MNLVERLRLIVLSVLFAGSAAIVFAAITLVKAAVQAGATVSQAAATNAPLFIQFSKVALVASILLIIVESIHYKNNQSVNRKQIARYAASLLCVISTFIFALTIVPQMETLLPHIHEDSVAMQEFTKLHSLSRMVFGSAIVTALASLLLTELKSPTKEIASKIIKPTEVAGAA